MSTKPDLFEFLDSFKNGKNHPTIWAANLCFAMGQAVGKYRLLNYGAGKALTDEYNMPRELKNAILHMTNPEQIFNTIEKYHDDIKAGQAQADIKSQQEAQLQFAASQLNNL